MGGLSLPPPLPGMPPHNNRAGYGGGGVPPPPHPDADAMMIPQPMAPSADLAIASSGVIVDGEGVTGSGMASMLGIGLSGGGVGGARTAASVVVPDDVATAASRGLVFAGTSVDECGDEMSMEELRMRIPRYWNSVVWEH